MVNYTNQCTNVPGNFIFFPQNISFCLYSYFEWQNGLIFRGFVSIHSIATDSNMHHNLVLENFTLSGLYWPNYI